MAVLLLMGFVYHGVAQNKYKFDIKSEANPIVDIEDKFEKSFTAKDSLSFLSTLQKEVTELWAEGYLTASLDTTYIIKDTLKGVVFIGDLYMFGNIRISNTNLAIVASAGLKNVRWKEKTLDQSIISEYSEALLTYLENNGYPFAKIKIDSTDITNGVVNGALRLDRKKFVPFDSLNIIGNVNLNRSYLDRYLDIKVNEPYSRKKINNITKRINDLPFLELDGATQIKFANDFAEIQIHLKPKKASRFDFIIGVLPTNNGGERSFAITGEFTAEMYNRLGRGEYIFASLKSINPTRELDLRFKYPYLYSLPIGIDIKSKIFFNEEFRETALDAGILYQFDGNSALKASWNFKASRLIQLDTAAILSSRRLPNKLDIAYNGGGIEYSNTNVDYRFNPSKGYQIRLGGTVGLKKIIRNISIESLSTAEIDFSQAYDTLALNTLQTELSLSGAYYLPTLKVGTLKFGLEGGLQYNQDRIYDNELHRIGGNKLLRGFDEQSILADIYLVSTLEFRLILDRNSYLSFPFIDYGITRIRDGQESVWDTALSFGMGINFATPAGIFNVSFAAGRRLDNPFDFGNTKIHFGYVSLF